jgi:hypothetical protein
MYSCYSKSKGEEEDCTIFAELSGGETLGSPLQNLSLQYRAAMGQH